LIADPQYKNALTSGERFYDESLWKLKVAHLNDQKMDGLFFSYKDMKNGSSLKIIMNNIPKVNLNILK